MQGYKKVIILAAVLLVGCAGIPEKGIRNDGKSAQTPTPTPTATATPTATPTAPTWTQRDARISKCRDDRKWFKELWPDQEFVFKCEGAVIIETWKLYRNEKRIGYIRYYKDKSGKVLKTVVDK